MLVLCCLFSCLSTDCCSMNELNACCSFHEPVKLHGLFSIQKISVIKSADDKVHLLLHDKFFSLIFPYCYLCRKISYQSLKMICRLNSLKRPLHFEPGHLLVCCSDTLTSISIYLSSLPRLKEKREMPRIWNATSNLEFSPI